MRTNGPCRRSLPVHAWPVADRLAWEAALAGSCDNAGSPARIADWKRRTVRNAASSIGQFAAWAQEEGLLAGQSSIHEVTTPATVKAFITSEQCRLRLGAIGNHVFYLLAGLEVFAPGTDWTWLRRVHGRVKARSKREIPGPRNIVHSSRLAELGWSAMTTSVDEEGVVDLAAFRDGLAVAMLIMAPMRIDNFSTLRLGREVKPDGKGWAIRLAGSQTKTEREDGWRIDGDLAEQVTFYIDVVRPGLLAQSRRPISTDRLWLGQSGGPVGQQIVRAWIKATTQAGLGTCVLPHSFRHCAVTTFVVEKPERAMEAGALLGHRSSATTERHYIMQQRQLAQSQYLGLLREKRRSE